MSRRGSISCETKKKYTYIFEKKVQFFMVFGIDCCFKQRYKYVLQHLPKTRQNIFWSKYVTERGKNIHSCDHSLISLYPSFTLVFSVICFYSTASVLLGFRNSKFMSGQALSLCCFLHCLALCSIQVLLMLLSAPKAEAVRRVRGCLGNSNPRPLQQSKY